MANMDDTTAAPADVNLWLTQNPDILNYILGDDNGEQNNGTDTESVNPADLTVNTNQNNSDYSNYNNADYSNTSGFQAPQELVPAAPDASMPNMPIGPFYYHHEVGWYCPAAHLVNAPPPAPMIPLAGATPATSVPTSAMPSGTSTPIPGPSNAPASNRPAGPSRPRVKPKYGPGIFDNGRKSIGNDEANFFASSASRRDGRSDKKSSFDTSFARRRNRPSIVQACVCQDHAAERIKRPKNAFILFRLSKADEIRKGMGTSFNPDVSKAASQLWKAAPKHVKDHFYAMAEAEKLRHAEKYPDYKYKPGGQLRTKFGDKECTCGAYELNMARFNEKRGIVEGGADDAEDSDTNGDDDDAYVPSRTRAAPTAVMQAPPDIDISSLGLPGNQAAQAAAALTTLKRKHNLTVTTGRKGDEEPPRKRRSPRSTAGTVNYAEPPADFDEEEQANFDANLLFDFDASCKTPSTGKVEHFANNKRKNSASPVESTPARQTSIITIKSEESDSDADGETIVVAPRKPSPAKKQKKGSSTSTQGSGRSGVSTRSQTGRSRSLRSGGSR